MPQHLPGTATVKGVLEEWHHSNMSQGKIKKNRMHKQRNVILELRREHLAKIWSLYPSKGFRANCFLDNTNNYGLHGQTLNFQPRATDKVRCGTFSIGRYENGHLEKKYKRTHSQKSMENIEFLSCVKQYLQREFPSHKDQLEYLRVNCVQGAQTMEHTDTMRGATPNFVFIRPGSNFQLRVRNFPLFKNSVVLHGGKHYIPHQYKQCQGLTMIGLWKGVPRFILFPPEVIDMLEPFGDITEWVVVGVNKGKLQVLGSRYKVHHTTSELPNVEFHHLVDVASKNRSVRPRYMYTYMKKEDHCQKEFLWNKAHRWQDGSNHDCSRFYVFSRSVREETPCARLRPGNFVTVDVLGEEVACSQAA